MPIPQPFYLNAPSLGSATAVFSDADMTVCAPDGFYSDGIISRQQIGCVLLPQQTCPNCCEQACASWNIKSTGETFSVKYLNCGGNIVVEEYPHPTDTNICVAISDVPNVITGSCILTLDQSCGCCTTACETWTVSNVITPTADVSYIDCEGNPQTDEVLIGASLNICIQSGTKPTITAGDAEVNFWLCDCGE